MLRLLGRLTPKERGGIIGASLGLEDGKALTLEDTGKRFSLTRERIRQIEVQALNKLRRLIGEEKIKQEGACMPENIRKMIRDVPDFPKKGILFKDITTLLADGPTFKRTIDLMAARYADKGIDRVVAVEARGFILGAPLAVALGAGFVPVRAKKGSCPSRQAELFV